MNIFHKLTILFFYILILSGLILSIYSVLFCLHILNSEKNDNENNFKLQQMALFSIVLMVVGNIYVLGNLIAYLIFYPIEKEFFPVAKKKFYHRINIFKNISSNGVKYMNNETLEPLLITT